MYLTVAILFVIFLSTVLIGAIYPVRSQTSIFELNRRKKLGEDSDIDIDREELAPYIISIKRVKLAALLMLFAILAFASFGSWGIGLSMIVALFYGRVSSLSFVRKLVKKLYTRNETFILKLTKKAEPYLVFISSVEPVDISSSQKIGSLHELMHMINETTSVLTQDEKKLILSGLEFDKKTVGEIMTPRKKIKTVSQKDFLGPLVLDELHKIGHSKLPVIDKDIDNIVGILNIKGHLSLDEKKSITVAKAMDQKVFYIHEGQKLIYALKAFVKTRHHLFIVINSNQETQGIVTLKDVIESLIGRQISDEIDEYTNINEASKYNQSNGNVSHPKDI